MAPSTFIPPPATAPRWRDIALGKIDKEWEFLAVKIMLVRIGKLLEEDSSPANLDKCANEIHAFFAKNARLAQKDISAIFDGQGA